jgi:hypothetical protein
LSFLANLSKSVSKFSIRDIIERVLDANRTARLRELPGYLVVSQKLQTCINEAINMNSEDEEDIGEQ